MAGVEVEHGAIVGATLTLRPTSTGFMSAAMTLCAWCGFDALFLLIMLGERPT
jgi:hypothetical protein